MNHTSLTLSLEAFLMIKAWLYIVRDAGPRVIAGGGPWSPHVYKNKRKFLIPNGLSRTSVIGKIIPNYGRIEANKRGSKLDSFLFGANHGP